MPTHELPPPSADTILREAIAALLERQDYDVLGSALLEQTDVRQIIFQEEWEAFRRALPPPTAWAASEGLPVPARSGAEEVKRIGDAICNLVACHRGFLCDPEVSRWIERFAEDHFSVVGLQSEPTPGQEPEARLVQAWEESGRWLRPDGRDLTNEERASVNLWIRSTLLFFQRLSRAVSGALGRDKREGAPGWGLVENRQRAIILAWGQRKGHSDGSLESAIAAWENPGITDPDPKYIQTWKQANRHLIDRWKELLEPHYRKTHRDEPESLEDTSDVEPLPE